MPHTHFNNINNHTHFLYDLVAAARFCLAMTCASASARAASAEYTGMHSASSSPTLSRRYLTPGA